MSRSFRDFSSQFIRYSDTGFSLDCPVIEGDAEFEQVKERVLKDMLDLERGAIVNPDEDRRVGHFWLRNPDLAPDEDTRTYIQESIEKVKNFSANIKNRTTLSPSNESFSEVLWIGIGGSVLGVQFASAALVEKQDMVMHYLDNCDPDGIEAALSGIKNLSQTLVVVVSKSGNTVETLLCLKEVEAAFSKSDLNFRSQAVAVTGNGSTLDERAAAERWLEIFEIPDWVGGRFSITSVVGLLALALQGVDHRKFLDGAAMMDLHTRSPDMTQNAAMRLARFWYLKNRGSKKKNMVVLPYKDSLRFMARYLQQLIMESLGKRNDLAGNVVYEGLTVYGNKGTTDQHSYGQQLRDGLNDFFVVFVEVQSGRKNMTGKALAENRSGDYLFGYLRGTRKAFQEAGRDSITISLSELTPYTLGALVALFERAVSFYGSIVQINPYHQPGVTAGKKSAEYFLKLLKRTSKALTSQPVTVLQLAAIIEADPEDVFYCLGHLVSNKNAAQVMGTTLSEDKFSRSEIEE